MPSPLGHALGGIAAGWLAARPDVTRRGLRLQAAILAGVAIAPDLDLVVGRHSGESHSIGAAVIVASIAAWQRWPVARERWRIWLAVCLAWCTHPLLDALASDTSVPIGIMAFWPFRQDYVHTGVVVFAPIFRRWWLPGFSLHNVGAILRELAILLPLTTFVWLWRRPRAREAPPPR